MILLLFLVISLPISYAKVIDIPAIAQKGVGEGAEPLRDDSNVKKFVYASEGLMAVVEGNEVKYHHKDRLSYRLTTDSFGNLDKEFKSLPFGQGVENSGIDYPFTGKEEDESFLYYFGARYYDANLGRFTGVDPYSGVGRNLPYAYVANNPMNAYDTKGEFLQFLVPLGVWAYATAVDPTLQMDIADLSMAEHNWEKAIIWAGILSPLSGAVIRRGADATMLVGKTVKSKLFRSQMGKIPHLIPHRKQVNDVMMEVGKNLGYNDAQMAYLKRYGDGHDLSKVVGETSEEFKRLDDMSEALKAEGKSTKHLTEQFRGAHSNVIENVDYWHHHPDEMAAAGFSPEQIDFGATMMTVDVWMTLTSPNRANLPMDLAFDIFLGGDEYKKVIRAVGESRADEIFYQTIGASQNYYSRTQ